MRIKTEMSERSWNLLSKDCKRELIKAVSIVETDKNIYSIGSCDHKDTWLLFKRPNGTQNYKEIVDEWR